MNKLVENYMIKEILGSGMYGNVHLSKQIHTGETFAIKIVSKETFKRVTCLERLTRNEIRALKNMRNDNII